MISPLLCIPCISNTIKEKDIKYVLSNMNIGVIKYYEEIILRTNKDFKRVLFSIIWNEKHPYIHIYKERVENDKSLKLVYDFPWFWIAVISNRQKIEDANK